MSIMSDEDIKRKNLEKEFKFPEDLEITFKNDDGKFIVSIPFEDFEKLSKLIVKALKKNKINATWKKN